MPLIEPSVSSTGNLIAILGGAQPAAGDEVLLSSGTTDITEGAAFTNDLLTFRVTRGYSGSFLTPVELVANRSGAGRVIYEGSGRRFQLRSTSASGVIREVWFNPAGPCEGTLDQCDNEHVYAHAGNLTITPAADAANIYVAGAAVEAVAGGPAATLAECSAGSLLLRRDAGTARVMGSGVLLLRGSAVSPGTLDVRGGRAELQNCGDVTACNVDAGDLDLRALTRPITIGTLTVRAGSRVLISSSTVVPTISALNLRGLHQIPYVQM